MNNPKKSTEKLFKEVKYFKSIYKICFLIGMTSACLLAGACGGSDDGPTIEPVPEGVMRISADKVTIVANGADKVTVSAMYGSKEVSGAPTFRLIKVQDGKEEQLTNGSNTFTTSKPGNYTLKATYYEGKEIESENELHITATADDSGTGKSYKQKLLGMQFTSIGCKSCPNMSATIQSIQKKQPGVLVPVSFHLDFPPLLDPMKCDMSDAIQQKLGFQGLPNFFMNYRKEASSTGYPGEIEELMRKELEERPATCGVAISSKYDAPERKVSVTLNVTSNVENTYRYMLIAVEDDIEYFQEGAREDYKHNNVVRKVASANIYGEKLGDLTAGAEVEKNVSFTLPTDWNAENMRIVVAALTSYDGEKTYNVNNVNECPLIDGVADYEYNE